METPNTERIVYYSNKIENIKLFMEVLEDDTNNFSLKAIRPITETESICKEISLSKRLRTALINELNTNIQENKDKLLKAIVTANITV